MYVFSLYFPCLSHESQVQLTIRMRYAKTSVRIFPPLPLSLSRVSTHKSQLATREAGSTIRAKVFLWRLRPLSSPLADHPWLTALIPILDITFLSPLPAVVFASSNFSPLISMLILDHLFKQLGFLICTPAQNHNLSPRFELPSFSVSSSSP